MDVHQRLGGEEARRDQIVEHHDGVHIDEIGTAHAAHRAPQRERKAERRGRDQPRKSAAAQDEQRLDDDARRECAQRRSDRPLAREHDLDVGLRVRVAQGRDRIDEAPVGAVQLVALMDANDTHGPHLPNA